VLHFNPKHFSFRSKGYTSNILEAAYDRWADACCLLVVVQACLTAATALSDHTHACCRYTELMFDTPDYDSSHANSLSKQHKHRTIDHLDVYVYSFDQSLNLDTDESYTLTVRLFQMHLPP